MTIGGDSAWIALDSLNHLAMTIGGDSAWIALDSLNHLAMTIGGGFNDGLLLRFVKSSRNDRVLKLA